MVAERVKIPLPIRSPPRRWSPRSSAGGAPPRDRAGFGRIPRDGPGRRGPVRPPFLDQERAGQPGRPPARSPCGRGSTWPTALTRRSGIPTKVANDADIQGAAVVSGRGLELVITLGTGFGTGLFYQGQLMPHLEIAHQPFRKGETYNEQLGEPTRKEIGEERWNKRVRGRSATCASPHVLRPPLHRGRQLPPGDPPELPEDVTVVDNSAGILGGIRLWEPIHFAVNQPEAPVS